jgi:hypothetical protein
VTGDAAEAALDNQLQSGPEGQEVSLGDAQAGAALCIYWYQIVSRAIRIVHSAPDVDALARSCQGMVQESK